MGILTVDNKLISRSPRKVEMVIDWLKQECNATLVGTKELNHSIMYFVEGDGIPFGDKQFSCMISEVVEGVFSIKIN